MRRVAWVKHPHKISLLPKQGEILLENNTFKDFILLAWICKDCEKILVDYSDREIHQNSSVSEESLDIMFSVYIEAFSVLFYKSPFLNNVFPVLISDSIVYFLALYLLCY
jgi:hypothetical protein